jgi:hypothetical protein
MSMASLVTNSSVAPKKPKRWADNFFVVCAFFFNRLSIMWPALKTAANIIGPGGELVLWVALLLSFVQLIVVVLCIGWKEVAV